MIWSIADAYASTLICWNEDHPVLSEDIDQARRVCRRHSHRSLIEFGAAHRGHAQCSSLGELGGGDPKEGAGCAKKLTGEVRRR
jgi:hypothetical protein